MIGEERCWMHVKVQLGQIGLWFSQLFLGFVTVSTVIVCPTVTLATPILLVSDLFEIASSRRSTAEKYHG